MLRAQHCLINSGSAICGILLSGATASRNRISSCLGIVQQSIQTRVSQTRKCIKKFSIFCMMGVAMTALRAIQLMSAIVLAAKLIKFVIPAFYALSPVSLVAITLLALLASKTLKNKRSKILAESAAKAPPQTAASYLDPGLEASEHYSRHC